MYVDDLLIFGDNKNHVKEVKRTLSRQYKMTDLGAVQRFLGLRIRRDRNTRVIDIDQEDYIQSVLERFNMADCKPVGTPMDPGVRLTKDMCPTTDAEREEMASVPYINAVGALMYLATATRPDIANAVSILARFSSNPGLQHWQAVKHLMRYLKGTMDMKLTYSPSPTGDFLSVL